MAHRLQDKVAIVNGAGSCGPGWGNGKATAVQFAREGAKVVVVDNDPAAAAETAKLIRDEGGRALVLEADVAVEDDMKRVVAACLKEFGRLDVLMQNVGIPGRGDLFTETVDSWRRVFAVNLDGVYFAARAALPPMLEQKSGSIITVSSIAAIRSITQPNPYSYSVSKAAVIAMTQMMAVDFADRGIRCNCLTLGMMDTPLVRTTAGDHAETISALRDAASPTGKQGTGWDTAHAAVYLASDESKYVNGLNLVLDGGYTVASPRVYPKM